MLSIVSKLFVTTVDRAQKGHNMLNSFYEANQLIFIFIWINYEMTYANPFRQHARRLELRLSFSRLAA